MSLKDDIPLLIQTWKDDVRRLTHNAQLFDIYEGDLLKYILADLQESLSENSYKQIQFRVAPINVLKRLIDKLSKIYSKSPKRTTQTYDGKDAGQKDQDLVSFYQENLELDVTMNQSNEFFNLFKNTWIEPYLDEGKPRLRVIPSDRFFVYSNDKVNPLRVTHLVKIMGTFKPVVKASAIGQDTNNSRNPEVQRTLFFAYTKDEFLAFDDQEEIHQEIMNDIYKEEPGSMGLNPFGIIPGIYINRSRFDLIPKIDSDTLTMTKIIPVLLSDLNFATMFQAFSIIYGIDLDEQELKMSPNAFWRFKSDPANPTARPSVGVITPQTDIQKVLQLIQTELSFWMNSRNIRPGTIGVLNYDNVASGIAKVIDEMDTSEDRQKQVPYFVDAEKQLWKQIIENFHPIWSKRLDFPTEGKVQFSPGTKVSSNFAEQRPMVDRSKLIADEVLLITNKLESREGALQTLNPDWSDDQIDAKILEIDAGLPDDAEQPTIPDQSQEDPSSTENGSEGQQDPAVLAK